MLRRFNGMLMLLAFSCGLQTVGIDTAVGEEAVIRLPAHDGEVVEIAPGGPRLRVLCFLGTECPLTRLYAPRLQQLSERFRDQDVQFIGINANLQDSPEDLADYVQEYGITFPVCKDYDQVALKRFGATRTPEVMVVDRFLQTRYHGRIDDQYLPGLSRAEPSRTDLTIALEELLAGQTVTVAVTEPAGCLIGQTREDEVTTDITYTQDVAPILETHCVECHQAGEIGPFALTDFEEIVGWGDMMVEVIDQGRMPPWHANPEVGHFSNSRFMPEKDKDLLRQWVAGGMPYGAALAGSARTAPDDEDASAKQVWQFDKAPDQVVAMSPTPFTVPATGTVDYQYFVVDPGFTEDKWIRGAQVIPGNRSVVHHAIVFVRPPDGVVFRGLGWLTAYVPGQRVAMFPEGYARRIPAGSRLVFQMHYTPNGSVQDDLTKVGMVFGNDEGITDEVFTLVALNQEFEIPPGDPNYEVQASLSRLPEDGYLLAAAPHMHLRGASFRLFAESGAAETELLDVPHYDFNWQHVYQFADPLPLKGLEALWIQATFNNSESNPVNPNPQDYVTWGDQTWEEMAIAFFEVAVPLEPVEAEMASSDVPSQEPQIDDKAVDEFVAQFFRRFDKDKNGEILEEELPLTMQRFAFHRFDDDNNGRWTPEEIRNRAEWQRQFRSQSPPGE